MGKRFSHNLYSFLFMLCIGITYINIYELTFAIWLLTACITLQSKYSFNIIKGASYFIAIIAIGGIVSLFSYNSYYAIFKDLSYFLKPIVGLIVGYQLYIKQKNSGNGFKLVIYTGLLIAIAHLLVLSYTIVVYKVANMHVLRTYGGYFSDFEIYALILIIFSKQFNINISRQEKLILFSIVGLSSFLYLSRTNFIQFIILYMAMKGYFTVNKRSVSLLISTICLSLFAYGIIYMINPSRNGEGLEAFFFKIRNAPIEAFKTKVNTENWKDFNDNFRSYENIITLKQVSADGASAIIFGKGFGSKVDVGTEVYTNDEEWIRYLPIVHNGYTTVFMKTGITGVILTILFIVFLFRKSKTFNDNTVYISLLMRGTAVFMIVSTWVFLGLYQKHDVKSILIGYFICMIYTIRKQDKILNHES